MGAFASVGRAVPPQRRRANGPDLLASGGDFGAHLQGGNQIFAPSAADVTDLVAFLRTIDDTTPVFELPGDQDICPVEVVPTVE